MDVLLGLFTYSISFLIIPEIFYAFSHAGLEASTLPNVDRVRTLSQELYMQGYIVIS